jgi:DNA modification methylase
MRGDQHTVADLAREVLGPDSSGARVGSLSNEQTKAGKLLTIAQHLDHPDVASAKSLSEAMRAVEKKVRAETYVSNLQAATVAATPHTLLRGDAYDLLPTLPPATFDCLISDPPYGVGADSFGDQAGAAHNYSDNRAEADRAYEFLAKQGFRLTKPGAHAFVFCDIRQFYQTSVIFSLEGWAVWQTPLIWAKGSGMLPRPGFGPRRAYEAIIFASKGNKGVQQTVDDVFSIPGVADPRRGAEKPAELFTRLLRMVSMPGDRVLDPFCGTGPVFEASTRLHLTAVGVERDELAQGIAMDRLTKPAGILDL